MAAIFRQLRALDKIPGPKRKPWPVGNLGDIPKGDRLSFMYQLEKWRHEYGPVYKIWIGPIPMVVVADPVVCRDTLARDPQDFAKGPTYKSLQPWLGRSILLSEGSRWGHKRDVMARAFRLAALKSFVPCFQGCTERLASRWRELIEKNEDGSRSANVEVLDWMTRLTQDAIGLAAFGYDFHGVDSWPNLDERARLYTMILDEMVVRDGNIAMQVISNEWYLRTKSGRRFQEAIDEVNGICRNIVHRRINGERPEQPDLLEYMMTSENSENDLHLDPEELVNEVHLFLFAGHETTTTTITWALNLLQQNPAALARVHEEIASIKDMKNLTYNDMNQLKYTLNVVKETLRLRSPTTAFVRAPLRDDVIAGYEVPANVSILYDSRTMHYDPALWPDPERFDPDRFTPENSKGRHPFAWAPFALGARNWYVLLFFLFFLLSFGSNPPA